MDLVSDLEVCFGASSKKWIACFARLSQFSGNLMSLIITRQHQTTAAAACSSLTQFIPLNSLTSCCSLYHSAVRPHCVELVRKKKSHRITVSFPDESSKQAWRGVLLQHINQQAQCSRTTNRQLSQGDTTTKGSQEETPPQSAVQSSPAERVIVTKPYLSESDSLSEDDENIYETIETYNTPPPLPVRTAVGVNTEKPIQTSPPLPRRQRLSDTQKRTMALYNSANELLQKIFQLNQLDKLNTEHEEQQPDGKESPYFELSSATSGEKLIDFDEGSEEVHFDSIPIPEYPSPPVPRHSVVECEYLEPQPASAAAKSEPVYARIIKKPRPADKLISDSVHRPTAALKVIS